MRARLWPAVAAAVAVLAGLAASELAQRRVVRSPRLGSSAAEFVSDDAFRARLMLDIARAAAAFAVAAVILAFAPLNGVHRGGVVSLVVSFLPPLALASFAVMSLATAWTQRYFLRGLPREAPGGLSV